MCVQFMKIRSSSKAAPKFGFVPCGKCEECRQSKKNQWTFRLRCELDWCRSNGWNIGFFTLTYNDAHIPHLPVAVFKNSADYVKRLCFSRYDMRTFIDNIRKRVHEDYQVKSLRYMLCSEFGDTTKRSHYHGLICFPPEIPPDYMFNLIKSNWTKKGFVFPRDIRGGIDSHGFRHKPFLIEGDTEGAANYAAKYCCKDIGFYASIAGLELHKDMKLYRDSMPIHIQSQGIGRTFLLNRSSDELVKLFRNGESFLGQTETKNIPLYIKNKVLFSPEYVFEAAPNGDWWYDFGDNKWRYKKGSGTHKRLVRRKATSFFEENVKEIYAQKREYYKELFTQMADSSFWSSRQVPLDLARSASAVVVHLYEAHLSVDQLTDGFLCYYGVDKRHCYDVPLHYQYLSRYKKMSFKGSLLVDSFYLEKLKYCLTILMDTMKFAVPLDTEKRKRLAAILDYYHHHI